MPVNGSTATGGVFGGGRRGASNKGDAKHGSGGGAGAEACSRQSPRLVTDGLTNVKPVSATAVTVVVAPYGTV